MASTDQGSLLWTLEEIGRLVSTSGDPAETLANVVDLIHRRFEIDVCSVYLLEQDRANLVLAATIGLKPESIGRVRMRITEGLAGLVAEQIAPQVLADAATHPRFKFFPEAGEEAARPIRTSTRTTRATATTCCGPCAKTSSRSTTTVTGTGSRGNGLRG